MSSSRTPTLPPLHEQTADVTAPITLHRPRKGRGAVSNLAHRFDSVEREPDGDALDDALRGVEDDARGHALQECGGDALNRALREEGADLPPLATTVTHERARSLLAYNDSPDIPFDRSINPYRGCEHGCIYCYARPTHSYLNLSPGLDFETKLTAKVNAAEVLRRELAARAYKAEVVNIGSATDAYQPIERELKITRAVLGLLLGCRHPFSIVTKSSLVERDLDLLQPAAAQGLAAVFISVTTLDHELSRTLEPRAASPARRLRTIETLARAGVPVHVNAAPVIPFITEPELEKILEAAANAGAIQAHYTVLRLPWEVNPLFQEWLQAHFPQRAQRVMNRVRDMRGGKDYEAEFKTRMKGDGPWADLIRQRFTKACDRLGLGKSSERALRKDLFVPPPPMAAQTSDAQTSRAQASRAQTSQSETPQLGLF